MPISKKDLYVTYLSKEGYRPEVDKDGDVIFKKEGNTFLLYAHENDEQYFGLCLPNFWPIKDEQERQKVLVACDYSNWMSKVSKTHLVKDNVWCTVELVLPKPADFEAIFPRALGLIANGIKNFTDKMQGTAEVPKA